MSLKIQYLETPITSGSTDYNLDLAQIITDVLVFSNQIGENDVPTSAQFTSTQRVINNMLKTWRSEGIFINTFKELIYSLKNPDIVFFGGSDYQCIKNHISTTKNQPTSNLGRIYWTELETTTNTDWSEDQFYSSSEEQIMDEPMFDVTEIWSLRENTRIKVNKLNKKDFDHVLASNIGLGASDRVEYFYFERKKNPIIHFFPRPQNDSIFQIQYFKQIDDLDKNTDFSDTLQQWIEAITYNAAVRVATKTQLSGSHFSKLEGLAREAKQAAQRRDKEASPVYLRFKASGSPYPGYENNIGLNRLVFI